VILLDTHVAFWVLSDPARLSKNARASISDAAELGVASITWYELAWLIDAGRIEVEPDPTTWLRDASQICATIPLTWSIAHAAADLDRHDEFPKDPADRIIYSTAVSAGIPLVTKDRRLRAFDRRVCVW
jgi:PIN domain nuclease of toxin-antitoxin system